MDDSSSRWRENFFVQHTETVKKALKDCLSPIRDELHLKGLIKPDVYELIKDRNVRLSSSERVELVIECLKDKVELDPNHLNTFYSIIGSKTHCPHYNDILKLFENFGELLAIELAYLASKQP